MKVLQFISRGYPEDMKSEDDIWNDAVAAAADEAFYWMLDDMGQDERDAQYLKDRVLELIRSPKKVLPKRAGRVLPVRTLTLPNGSKTRVVRKDILDRALARMGAKKK